MKIKLKVTKEFEATELHVKAGARYWVDSRVNGVEDTEEGDNIPCKMGDYWCPIIDIATGVIKNWEQGKTARIHYKVCDDGEYWIKDAEGNVILSKEGYVPDIMCPEEEGFGDYIIMTIDESGRIADWNPSTKGFQENNEN